MPKIAIFAGHGGNDTGAKEGSLHEKDFALQISNKVTAILRAQGYTVINNRTEDIRRSITNDALYANEEKADALVEIHLNSNDGTSESGSEAFISIRDKERGGTASKLAKAILSNLGALGFINRGVFTSVNEKGVDTFGILRLTDMPAVLLEVAFINNPQDMKLLVTATVAEAIADGIKKIFPA